MAPRDCVAMLYLDDGIPVNSATFANEETWFIARNSEPKWAVFIFVTRQHTCQPVNKASV